MDEYSPEPRVVNETIRCVLDFLVTRHKKHIGADEIHEFMGSGWSLRRVSDALKPHFFDRFSTTPYQTIRTIEIVQNTHFLPPVAGAFQTDFSRSGYQNRAQNYLAIPTLM